MPGNAKSTPPPLRPAGWLPPISPYEARLRIWGLVLIGLIFFPALPFVISIQAASRAWRLEPWLAWRGFTLLSVLAAGMAAIVWALIFQPPSTNTLAGVIANWTMAYIVWSIVMMPHCIARAIWARRR